MIELTDVAPENFPPSIIIRLNMLWSFNKIYNYSSSNSQEDLIKTLWRKPLTEWSGTLSFTPKRGLVLGRILSPGSDCFTVLYRPQLQKTIFKLSISSFTALVQKTGLP